MFDFIFYFFNKTQASDQPQAGTKRDSFCNIYNKQYRDAYSRLWITKLQNYNP